jgi:hypothetical protein
MARIQDSANRSTEKRVIATSAAVQRFCHDRQQNGCVHIHARFLALQDKIERL